MGVKSAQEMMGSTEECGTNEERAALMAMSEAPGVPQDQDLRVVARAIR